MRRFKEGKVSPCWGHIALLFCLVPALDAEETTRLQLHYRVASVEQVNGWLTIPVFVVVANHSEDRIYNVSVSPLTNADLPPVNVYVEVLDPQQEYADVIRIRVPAAQEEGATGTEFAQPQMRWLLSYTNGPGQTVARSITAYSMDVPAVQAEPSQRGEHQ